MTYTNNDITLLISLFTFVFWQMSKTSQREMREIYKNDQTLPPWVFGVVWSILYLCIVLSGYFTMCSVVVIDQYYLARAIFFIVNIFLNKFWSVLFFDMRMYGWPSILTCILMIGTGIVYLVLAGLSYALTTGGTEEHTYFIVAIVLFSLYVGWCVFALYLNAVFKPSDKFPAQMKSKLVY
jgi:tryptophan-rich sensory protein